MHLFGVELGGSFTKIKQNGRYVPRIVEKGASAPAEYRNRSFKAF